MKPIVPVAVGGTLVGLLAALTGILPFITALTFWWIAKASLAVGMSFAGVSAWLTRSEEVGTRNAAAGILLASIIVVVIATIYAWSTLHWAWQSALVGGIAAVLVVAVRR